MIVCFFTIVKFASSLTQVFEDTDEEIRSIAFCQACVPSMVQHSLLNVKDINFLANCNCIFLNSVVSKDKNLDNQPETKETQLESLIETLQSGQCVISHWKYKFVCSVTGTRVNKSKNSQCPTCKSRKYMRLIYTCTSWREKKKSRACPRSRCWKCWRNDVVKHNPDLEEKSITTALSVFTFAVFPAIPPEPDPLYKLISPVDCPRHKSGASPLLIQELARYNFQATCGLYPLPDGYCLSNCLFSMMAELFDWSSDEDIYTHFKAWQIFRSQIFEWRDANQISQDLAQYLTEGKIEDYTDPKWTVVDDEEAKSLKLSRFSYGEALELLCKNLGMGLALMDDPWEKFLVVQPSKPGGDFLVRFTIPRAGDTFEKVKHFFIARPTEGAFNLVENSEIGDARQEIQLPKTSTSNEQDDSGDIKMGGVEDDENALRETFGVDIQAGDSQQTDVVNAETSARAEDVSNLQHLKEPNQKQDEDESGDFKMDGVEDDDINAETPARADFNEDVSNLQHLKEPDQEEDFGLTEDESSGWDISEERAEGITRGRNQDLELLGLGHVGTPGSDEENQENVVDDMKTREVVEPEPQVPDMQENLHRPVPGDGDANEDNEDQVGMVKEVTFGDDAQNRVVGPEAQVLDLANQNEDDAEQVNEDNENPKELEARGREKEKRAATNPAAKGTQKGASSKKKKGNNGSTSGGKGKGGKALGHGGGLKREIGCDDMPRIVPDYSISSTPEVIVGDRSATMTTCVFFLDGWVPEDTDVSFMADSLKDISVKFGRRITLSFSKNRRSLFKDLRFCSNQTLIREVIVFGHGVQGPGETNGILGAEVRISNKEARARQVVKFDEIIATFIRTTRSFQPDVGFVCCNYFRKKKFGDHLRRRYVNAVSQKFQALLTVCVEEDISLYQTTVRLPEILDSFISTKTLPFRFWKPSFKVQDQWRKFGMRKHEEEKLFILERLSKCKNHEILCTNSSWLYQYLGLQWKDVNYDRFQIVHRTIRERHTSVKTKEWLHIE